MQHTKPTMNMASIKLRPQVKPETFKLINYIETSMMLR